MKTARLLLILAGALAALSIPAAVQAQNQSRVAVCDRLFSDRCLTVGTEGSIPSATAPSSTPAQGLASVRTPAPVSSLSRTSPANVYSWRVTTGAVAGYVLIVNAVAAPADGAISPMDCITVAASSSVGGAYDVPERYSVGVTILFSTTGCFTLTKSETAFIRLRAL